MAIKVEARDGACKEDPEFAKFFGAWHLIILLLDFQFIFSKDDIKVGAMATITFFLSFFGFAIATSKEIHIQKKPNQIMDRPVAYHALLILCEKSGPYLIWFVCEHEFPN